MEKYPENYEDGSNYERTFRCLCIVSKNQLRYPKKEKIDQIYNHLLLMCRDSFSLYHEDIFIHVTFKYLKLVYNYSVHLDAFPFNRNNFIQMKTYCNPIATLIHHYHLEDLYTKMAIPHTLQWILQEKTWEQINILVIFLQCAGQSTNFKPSEKFPVSLLMDLITTSGHYQLQSIFVELMFRLHSIGDLKSQAHLEIIDTKTLCAFLSIRSTEASNQNVRDFLNHVNDNHNNLVHSIICKDVFIGNLTCQKPRNSEEVNGIWVDFNMQYKCLSWYADAKDIIDEVMTEVSKIDTTTCLFTLCFSDIKNVEHRIVPGGIELVIQFVDALVSSISDIEGYILDMKEVRLVLPKTATSRTLLNKVMPYLLGKKYSELSHKISFVTSQEWALAESIRKRNSLFDEFYRSLESDSSGNSTILSLNGLLNPSLPQCYHHTNDEPIVDLVLPDSPEIIGPMNSVQNRLIKSKHLNIDKLVSLTSAEMKKHNYGFSSDGSIEDVSIKTTERTNVKKRSKEPLSPATLSSDASLSEESQILKSNVKPVTQTSTILPDNLQYSENIEGKRSPSVEGCITISDNDSFSGMNIKMKTDLDRFILIHGSDSEADSSQLVEETIRKLHRLKDVPVFEADSDIPSIFDERRQRKRKRKKAQKKRKHSPKEISPNCTPSIVTVNSSISDLDMDSSDDESVIIGSKPITKSIKIIDNEVIREAMKSFESDSCVESYKSYEWKGTQICELTVEQKITEEELPTVESSEGRPLEEGQNFDQLSTPVVKIEPITPEKPIGKAEQTLEKVSTTEFVEDSAKLPMMFDVPSTVTFRTEDGGIKIESDDDEVFKILTQPLDNPIPEDTAEGDSTKEPQQRKGVSNKRKLDDADSDKENICTFTSEALAKETESFKNGFMSHSQYIAVLEKVSTTEFVEDSAKLPMMFDVPSTVTFRTEDGGIKIESDDDEVFKILTQPLDNPIPEDTAEGDSTKEPQQRKGVSNKRKLDDADSDKENICTFTSEALAKETESFKNGFMSHSQYIAVLDWLKAVETPAASKRKKPNVPKAKKSAESNEKTSRAKEN